MAGVKGNKGGGRKSAYQEHKDARMLWDVFLKQHTKEELTEILQSKHAIKDVWLAKAFAGNERFISQIIHKLFPEGIDITSRGKSIIPLFDYVRNYHGNRKTSETPKEN